MVEERAYWLIWSQISGIGPILLQRLWQHFGTLAAAWDAPAADLAQVEGFGPQMIHKVVQQRSNYEPEHFLEQHLSKNPCFWTPADADYPRLLLEIPSPPPVIYYRGTPNLQESQGIIPTLGIVGTRSPSEYGRRWTRKLTTILTQQGFTIVSGLAAGIDTEAHRACLEAGGRTLAIFGTGVDLVYPRENRALAEQILTQGLVMSEYPAGTQPNSTNFPRRNRIIAGLSRAILVMEAPKKSGALITAHVANELGRDVYVLPGRLDDEKSQGCLGLIDKGGQVIPVELEQFLEMLGAIPPLDMGEQLSLFREGMVEGIEKSEKKVKGEKAKPQNEVKMLNLDPELAKVLAAVGEAPTPFDGIVQQAGLMAGEVSSALLQLELMGLVLQMPGMRYQRQ